MVLIETVGQKAKIPTQRPRGQKFENPRRKETQERRISSHSKRLRVFEIGSKISEPLNLPGTIRHALYCLSFNFESVE